MNSLKTNDIKLLTTSCETFDCFQRLYNWCDNFSFCVAWASSGYGKAKHFQEIIKFPEKIKMGIVGLHFYQTEPEFLEYPIIKKRVKVILDCNGIFHPKLYLFEKNNKTYVIIGSSNFTTGGFQKNSEINIEISELSKDIEIKKVYDYIEKNFKNASEITDDFILKYKEKYNNKNNEIGKIMTDIELEQINTYSDNDQDYIDKMTWKDYFQLLNQMNDDGSPIFDTLSIEYNCPNSAFDEMIRANNIWLNKKSIDKMNLTERKTIAGIRPESTGWFGSMNGAGYFKNAIISNYNQISKALEVISLIGEITDKIWDLFVKEYKKAFQNAAVGTASRLLTTKRPDIFLSINGANIRNVSESLDFTRNKLKTFDGYYNLHKEIWNWNWVKSQIPLTENQIEITAWKYRVALLDQFYYEE